MREVGKLHILTGNHLSDDGMFSFMNFLLFFFSFF